MTHDPSNPITEPKRLPSRGKRVRDGLLTATLGVGAWVLFFVVNALIHVRFLPLPVVGLLMIGAGLIWAFAPDSGATSDKSSS